jgi:hypothetical protein
MEAVEVVRVADTEVVPPLLLALVEREVLVLGKVVDDREL